MPYKVFVAGEEALAADVNTHLMSQTVSRHASASARAAAITAPVTGQLTQLDTDPMSLQMWSGSAWINFANSALRYTHQTGYGTLGSSATATFNIPAFTYPRIAHVVVQFQIYITLASGSGAGGWTFRVVSNGANAPAVAPYSFISQTPNFTGGTVPLTALYRDVPANTNIAPAITIAGTGGAVVADIGGISGSMLFLPPGSEF